jgi:hypothetical protein
VVLEKDGEDQLDRSMREEEVLLTVKEKMRILHTSKRRKANWIGLILRRNCLPNQVIKGNIEAGTEVTGRQ